MFRLTHNRPSKRPNLVAAALVAAITSLGATHALAQDYPEWANTESERQGYDIAARADASDLGFSDSQVDARMILRNAAGQETARELSFQTLERTGLDVGDKSIVLFHTPRDVEGTALLSHAHILEPDNQWIYLPSLARVRRISSANKSGPFVGSEFSFEDLTALELNKYEYDFQGTDEITVAGETMVVDVVASTPRYENSGYTRLVTYIDQEVHQIRRIEYFDRRGDLLKTLEASDYRNYEGVWRPHLLDMQNHQTGKSTQIVYETFEFDVGLTNNDFVRGILDRIG
jgi:hypothetical protein